MLAADRERPERLAASGAGLGETRFTYAIGELVLWSRQLGECRSALDDLGDSQLAIANPDTAPYGTAAKQFLEHEGLWEVVRSRLVVGENISQVLQFTASGNAELGFIARSQLNVPAIPEATCSWPVPPSSHTAIEQQAILLERGSGNEAARRFMSFLQSDAGRDMIERHGYRLPGKQR